MLTVKWFGVFRDVMGKDHKKRLTFNGQSWQDVIKQVAEYIEMIEDNTARDWCIRMQRFGKCKRM